ncbi:MAG: hypothetical protein PF549_04565 [Patescibacteria group bacterium]|jgi:hypothetical protein|nr:hypothetical protein [Patescibacteria group bacterium]
MAVRVKIEELSDKAGMVAVRRTLIPDKEVDELVANFSKFALEFDGTFYCIYAE